MVIWILLPVGCVPLLPATLRSTVAPSVRYLVGLTILPPRPAIARGHVPTLICILSATRPADGRRTAFGDCLLIESLALGRTLARPRRMSELFLVRCRARIGALGFGRLRRRRASRLRRRDRIPSAARLRPIGSTAFEAIGVIGRASLLIARACATHSYIIRGRLRGGDGRSAVTNRGSIARRRVGRRGRPSGCVERRLRLRSTRPKLADGASGELEPFGLAAVSASGAAGCLEFAPVHPIPTSSRVRLWSCGNKVPAPKQASAAAIVKIGLKPDRRSLALGRASSTVSRAGRRCAPAPVSTRGDEPAKPVCCTVRSSGSNRFEGSRS
jgi:hypothetical protein